MTPCSFYADQNVAANKTHCSTHDQHPIDCAKALRAQLDALAKAAIEYDAAIESCANDPDTMATYCSAEGENLDTLYHKWVRLARGAI